MVKYSESREATLMEKVELKHFSKEYLNVLNSFELPEEQGTKSDFKCDRRPIPYCYFKRK